MRQHKDLSNFCDELEQFEGKKKVIDTLSRWFSSYDVDVFWRQSSDRYQSFAPMGQPSPDILIDAAGEVYAICVSHSERDSNTIRTTACDAVDIWERMLEQPPEYDLELSREVPTAVLLATEYSRDGHLFTGEKNREHPVTNFSEGRQKMADCGHLPQMEYSATQEITRMMWNFAKRRQESEQIGIGTLLSSSLSDKGNETAENPDPAALYYTPGSSAVHHWEAIPWFLWK